MGLQCDMLTKRCLLHAQSLLLELGPAYKGLPWTPDSEHSNTQSLASSLLQVEAKDYLSGTGSERQYKT